MMTYRRPQQNRRLMVATVFRPIAACSLPDCRASARRPHRSPLNTTDRALFTTDRALFTTDLRCYGLTLAPTFYTLLSELFSPAARPLAAGIATSVTFASGALLDLNFLR